MKLSRFEMAAIGAYSYLIFILILFQYGFWIYTLTPFFWNVYDAEIISSEPYIFEYKDENMSNMIQIQKEFSINNLLQGCFPVMPDEGKGDIIRIAINKKNSDICIRVDWLPISERFKFANIIMFLIVTIQNIEWLLKKVRKKRQNNVTIISKSEDD